MFYGKKKAITLSYDDGVLQDRRLVEILNKYGLKATFNINSELLGTKNTLNIKGKEIMHDKISADEVASLYAGHEVAVHTLTHPTLTWIDENEIIRQVEEDRKNLSRLVGYEVIGMAYPGGGFQNSDRVENVVKNHTGVKYSRTISLSYSFKEQSDIFRYKPTAYHMDFAINYKLADEFFAADEGIFYIWGHSYEFDVDDTWAEFEKFCEYISNKPDVYYGTNKEIII